MTGETLTHCHNFWAAKTAGGLGPALRLAAAIASIVAIVLPACSSQRTEPDKPAAGATGTSAPSVQPVSIPDFSRLPTAVRDQLQTAAASFTSKTARPDATAAENASAYGEFGILLMAAGFTLRTAKLWSRVVGIAFAGISMIANFLPTSSPTSRSWPMPG